MTWRHLLGIQWRQVPPTVEKNCISSSNTGALRWHGSTDICICICKGRGYCEGWAYKYEEEEGGAQMLMQNEIIP